MAEPRFLDRVADEAQLELEDAAELVAEFLSAIQPYISSEAWDLLISLVPEEHRVPGKAQRPSDEKTIKQFLLDLAGEEEVESPRAAEHARAVGMALQSMATPAEVSRLKQLIPEELLALFETEERGEMTGAEPERDVPEGDEPGE